MRVLVLPEREPARAFAVEQLSQHPEWYDGLPAASVLEALVNAPVPDNPLDAAPDEPSRLLLARTLQQEEDPFSSNTQSITEQVENALHTLQHRHLERRQREVRTLIAEADRRGDQEMLTQLTAEKMQIDRKLREH
jgi:DNA primase